MPTNWADVYAMTYLRNCLEEQENLGRQKRVAEDLLRRENFDSPVDWRALVKHEWDKREMGRAKRAVAREALPKNSSGGAKTRWRHARGMEMVEASTVGGSGGGRPT